MATYLIIDPEIRKVSKQGQNFGKEYLYAKIRLKTDFFADPQTFLSFADTVVSIYKQLLPIEKGGTAQVAQPIPPEASQIKGVWADFRPAQPFYKTHLSSHPASQKMINGQLVNVPEIKQGELVKDIHGNPVVYTTLRVFCRQALDDDTNTLEFVAGDGPNEAGQRAFNNYCVAANADDTPVAQAPQPATQPTAQQQQQQQAPAFTQPTNPNPQQFGANPQ